jgi:hypothetical protein
VPKSQKILSGIIIATALVFALVLLWQNFPPKNTEEIKVTTTPTPENVSDRINYKNDEYGFSFKYPKGWEVEKAIYEGMPILIVAKQNYSITFFMSGKYEQPGWFDFNLDDYVPIQTTDMVIFRPEATKDYEGWDSNLTYGLICIKSSDEKTCDLSFKTKKGNYFFIAYSAGIEPVVFDNKDKILSEMDEITKTLSF